MRRSTSHACLLALLLVTGCRSHAWVGPLEAPTVTVGIQHVSESEVRRLERFFGEELPPDWHLLERRGAGPREASGGTTTQSWAIRLGRWEDLRRLHLLLTALRDDETGHEILSSVRTDADLVYTSSRARSRSRAEITIRVSPPEAELVFDSAVPVAGIVAGRPVPTEDGRFELRLPFGFLRRAGRWLYFHSRYRGQYRFYRYDLDTEEQEVLPGVHTPEQFRELRRR